ncbi:MAG: hypothetical protein EB084_04870 [Proteobacteria bacterium]|nr:hypothetical protein [Pseudomonadota bacterium]
MRKVSTTFTVGARVKHPFLGPGSVLEVQRGGRVVRVCFDSKPTVAWLVVAAELETATEPAGMQAVISALALAQTGGGDKTPRPKKKKTVALLSDDIETPVHVPHDLTEAQALHAVEALRLGVVPRHLIETYTVGRAAEMAMVAEDLDATRDGGAFRVIMGDYGTGKTHHLEWVEELALSRNFITARITLDAREVPPSMPKRVYRSIVRSLRYPNQHGHENGGLAPLFDRILENAELSDELRNPEAETYHKYLSPALAYYAALREVDPGLVETLLDWIEGHPTVSNVTLDQQLKAHARKYHRLYALMDYCPWAHIYTYMLGGISVLAHRAGYAGLVILLDEAEFYSLLSSGHAYYAAVLFSYYATACMGTSGVKIDVDDLPRGGHPVHRAIPALYAPSQHMYVTFAITPDSAGVNVLRGLVDDSAVVELSPLNAGDYRELCGRVWGLYQHAYPDFAAPETNLTRLGDALYRAIEWGRLGNIRQALKLLTEIADFLRHDPKHGPTFLRRAEEMLGAASVSLS